MPAAPQHGVMHPDDLDGMYPEDSASQYAGSLLRLLDERHPELFIERMRSVVEDRNRAHPDRYSDVLGWLIATIGDLISEREGSTLGVESVDVIVAQHIPHAIIDPVSTYWTSEAVKAYLQIPSSTVLFLDAINDREPTARAQILAEALLWMDTLVKRSTSSVAAFR
jgi:hypothetical protein